MLTRQTNRNEVIPRQRVVIHAGHIVVLEVTVVLEPRPWVAEIADVVAAFDLGPGGQSGHVPVLGDRGVQALPPLTFRELRRRRTNKLVCVSLLVACFVFEESEFL